jgi:hypothetical protein
MICCVVYDPISRIRTGFVVINPVVFTSIGPRVTIKTVSLVENRRIVEVGIAITDIIVDSELLGVVAPVVMTVTVQVCITEDLINPFANLFR